MRSVETSSEPLQKQACAMVRQLIADGELAPGQAIIETDLAARFKMSRAPIREALVELENEGLIRRAGARTRVVAEITLEDMLEIFDLREMIEGMAARLLAPRVTGEDIEKLTGMARLIDVPNQLDEIERDFHGYIIDHCGNARLARLAAFVNPQVVHVQIRDFLIRKGQLPAEWQVESGTLHRDIVDAIASRDPDVAEAASQAHVRENKETLLACVFGTHGQRQETR
jgi:DNA-binding GntR family transcriptional regulator